MTQAPGKLLLAGEYAVLQPGGVALVAAVDRRIRVQSAPADAWCVESGGVRWSPGEPVPETLRFAAAAVEEARRRGAPARHLITTGEMSVGGRKLGLGSSAAATVAVLNAALGVTPSDESWRQADAIHREVQGGRGSGVDVAASHWGGVVRFSRHPLHAARVPVHPDWRLVVVRAEQSVGTAPRVASFERFVAEQPAQAQRFVSRSVAAVDALQSALAGDDAQAMAAAVGEARAALLELQRASGLLLETPSIARAAQIAFDQGACGKQSGAGGGDCAVLVVQGDAARTALIARLEREGLEAFPIGIAMEGVGDERA